MSRLEKLSKSTDLRTLLSSVLKKGLPNVFRINKRSKSLSLPKQGVIFSFFDTDNYFEVLKPGVYRFRGLVILPNESKLLKVYDSVLKKTRKGYLLKGLFSKKYDYEEVALAREKDFEEHAVSEKEVLETSQKGDEERPKVIKYTFKTGREVLYDLDKEIIASGGEVWKLEGAYKVRASKSVPGIVKLWEGPGSRGETLAKTDNPNQELLLDFNKNIIATGNTVIKREGAYIVTSSSFAKVPGVVRVFGDKNSKGKELVKTEKPEALLLDIEKEIIARGIAVDKVEGAYKVMASEDLPGVVKIWKGPNHEGDMLAKTEHPWEQLLLDIEKGVLALGSDVTKFKGVYKVVAPKYTGGQGSIMSWNGPGSEGKTIAKTTTHGEELVLDIDNNIEIHGAFIHIFENGEYLVHSKLSSQQEMPITVRIGDKTILENSAGTYKIFNQSDVWRINRTDEEDFQAVVDLDNDVNVSGFEVEVLDKGVYKVSSGSETLVNVKTLDGKTILENAKGTYKIYKKGDSWQVEKLRDEDG